jgi:hypothetical protein
MRSFTIVFALPILAAGIVQPAGAQQCPGIQENYVPTALSDHDDVTRFAVIGDYGSVGDSTAGVAEMVAGWQPAFIITTGDNNYPDGAAETIDANIGQYYSDFIGDYQGEYGDGSPENRFFPSLGNHDWVTAGAQPYLEYFTLPGNERYYAFTQGSVDFFALDSDFAEPDGISPDSIQGEWLREALVAAESPFQIVYMHHPPYSSAEHGSNDWMQWDFAAWGADMVLAGHDHTYERLEQDGIPYIVNGLGGSSIYGFQATPLENSLVRYNCDYGAMLVDATDESLIARFITVSGVLVDEVEIAAPVGERP